MERPIRPTLNYLNFTTSPGHTPHSTHATNRGSSPLFFGQGGSSCAWGTVDYYITRLTSPIPPLRIDVCNQDSNQEITDEDAVRLSCALLKGGGRGLKKLRLRGNGVGGISGKGFLALAEAFAMLASTADSADASDVTNAAETAETNDEVQESILALEELDLGRNQIGNDVESFTRGIHLLFEHAPNLKNLDLEGNQLGSRGGSAVADAILSARPRKLEMLNLYSNYLGEIATIQLANSLQKLYQYGREGDECNSEGEEGSSGTHDASDDTGVEDCMKGKMSLTRLDLGMNQIGINGGKALAELIAIDPPLQQLLLLGNSIDNTVAIKFSVALKSNTTLLELNLGFNKLTSLGLQALHDALYDVSSLNALWESNHTLESLFSDFCVDHLKRGGCDEKVIKNLENLLRINALSIQRLSSQSSVKILPLPTILLSKRPCKPLLTYPLSSVPKFKVGMHLRESMDMCCDSNNSNTGTGNMSPMRHFRELDTKIMPEVLEFISRNLGFENMVWLMSQWSMPILFQSMHKSEIACLGNSSNKRMDRSQASSCNVIDECHWRQ